MEIIATISMVKMISVIAMTSMMAVWINDHTQLGGTFEDTEHVEGQLS
ncbi:MAG: hypothetical protein JSS86_14775 [Cyanobacteria bacterium SZAS LIN-2]|nr:hypothetical protein [Cyanobacteria bacterium SZAS LIN-3]MBS1997582.1 hypothetical protein [Cyanobacteria bacterium SZAS LIN-2]MBS2008319.1 hypothetical protein [Cyanobacteria bacterium SZAS TMP-1]